MMSKISRVPSVYHLLLWILLLIAIAIFNGCTVGLRKQTDIVYASIGKQEEEFKGALRIATNNEIRVTIAGDKETVSHMDLGGYYAVSAADLKLFIKAVRQMKDQ